MTLVDLDLTGKSALVTGATAGIGLVVAEGLARQNAEVWINGRSRQRVESAVRLTLEHVAGANVKGVVGDVSTADGVESVILELPEVDVLVNTAGGTRRVAPFIELTDADWQLNWDLNVMSGVRLSRHYLPRMLAKGWGRIVLFSSDAGSYIPEQKVNYGVTKSAVESLARALAEQTAGTGVTSNCIVPGPTMSDWVLDAAAEKGLTPREVEAEYFPGEVASSLLQRFLKPEEVAHMALYVSSPASSGTNGAVLRVEGGILRHR
jgi:NAD(P)-dependent dehydrogenase (short-subunit alcohol dehydrogenase family)